MTLQKQQSQPKRGNAVDKQTTSKAAKEPITVEAAFNVLDRVIGFINNCDNKASIVLGGTAAILAIIFSSDGIKKITDIVSVILFPQTGAPKAGEVVYFAVLLLSMVLLVVGLTFLTLTIIARTKASGNSIIYFGHIAQFNDAAEYIEKVQSPRDDLLTDILNQIYINSTICSRKYKYYNRGIKCTVIGFAALIVVLIVGVFLF